MKFNSTKEIEERGIEFYNISTGVTDLQNPFLFQESQFPWALDTVFGCRSEGLKSQDLDYSFSFAPDGVKSCNIEEDSWSTFIPPTNLEDFSPHKKCDGELKGSSCKPQNPDLCVNPVKISQKFSNPEEENFKKVTANHFEKEVYGGLPTEDQANMAAPSIKSEGSFNKSEGVHSFDSYIDYSTLVDSILNRTDDYGNELSCRKDVLNKKILRAFRKYIAKCFKSKKRPSRSNLPFNKVKDNLFEEAVKIGLINPLNPDDLTPSYKEFICWMAMAKVTERTKKLFDYQNNSISGLADILSSYSHLKLKENIFTNISIGKCFKYFMKNGLNEFLGTVEEDKKCIYSKAAREILYNFGNLY